MGGLKFSFELYSTVARFTDATRIKYGPNPKTRNSKSYARYASYSKATTVGEARKLGVKVADFLWDLQRGYYKVLGGPISDVPGIIAQKGGAAGAGGALNLSGPRGCSLRVDAARRERMLKLAKRLGVDVETCIDDDLCQGETADMRTERRLAHILAERHLATADKTGCKISDAAVEEVLSAWAYAENEFRVNVMADDQTFVFSDTLGLVRTRTGVYHLTDATLAYPALMRLLMRWWADTRPAGWGEHFAFTSINLNCDYAARVHRDQNNTGPSAIKALGDFEGGRLWYWSKDAHPRPLATTLKKADAELLDIRKKWTLFDGNCGHGVEPFTGHRLSVVFFTGKRYHKLAPEHIAEVKALGLPWPTEQALARMRAYLESAKRPKAQGAGAAAAPMAAKVKLSGTRDPNSFEARCAAKRAELKAAGGALTPAKVKPGSAKPGTAAEKTRRGAGSGAPVKAEKDAVRRAEGTKARRDAAVSATAATGTKRIAAPAAPPAKARRV
eukprot:NODE_186_length_1846_cov_343.211614.p1 GENE.NODE_186_length_1846_cov_343.211614~~NODE_186_length_1846_cov_343.211614.p1  ORF type:complete len:502 (+),score=184.55 NODE_186_length_1846_cov_343.211614:3-1508(+)